MESPERLAEEYAERFTAPSYALTQDEIEAYLKEAVIFGFKSAQQRNGFTKERAKEIWDAARQNDENWQQSFEEWYNSKYGK